MAALHQRPETPDSVLVVAGEASGDQHGAALVAALRQYQPCLRIYGIGGDRMRAAGVETLFDLDTLSAVGAVEVCTKVPQGLRMARRLQTEALQRGTRVAVLIDVPGFNLPLARRLKRLGLRVIGYVSPQIWAWRPGRVHKIARRMDLMLTLFPFEVSYYRAAGLDAECVGHPLLDRVQSLPSPSEAARVLGLNPQHPILALLPGSRPQEVDRLCAPMLEALACVRHHLPRVQAVIPVASTVSQTDIQRLVQHVSQAATVVPEQSLLALQAADFAFVASGTATLEAGVLGTPMVVVYKVHPVTAWLARRLIRLPYIGLVNIVAGQQVVPELLQHDLQPRRLADYALACLQHPAEARRLQDRLQGLRQRLGPPHSAARAADRVWHMLNAGGPQPAVSGSGGDDDAD